MSILSTLSRLASDFRSRRLRARTHHHLASLPREIQKDIGWPASHLHDQEPWRTVKK